MALDLDVDPPDRLDLVARVLRDMSAKDLQGELYKGLNRATTKLKADARDEAGKRLPHAGGLADRVSRAKLATRRRGGRNPGVTVTAKGMAQLAGMDAGVLLHPVFGQRDVWVTQEISGGWFSEPMEAGRDEAAAAIEDVLDDLARKAAARIDGGI